MGVYNKRRTDKGSHCLASWVLAWASSGTARSTVSFLVFDCCCWHLKQGQISLEVQPLGALIKFLERCFRTTFKSLLPGQRMGQLLQQQPGELPLWAVLPGWAWLILFPGVLWVPNEHAGAAEIMCSDAALWVYAYLCCPVGFNCSSSSVCYVPLWCFSATVTVIFLFLCWFWCFWFLCLH